jgi:magnesium-dependent phosphatase 1
VLVADGNIMRLVLLLWMSFFCSPSIAYNINNISTRSGGLTKSCLYMAATMQQRVVHPELTVFDLDACFWDQEMYEMRVVPGPNDVVMGNLSGRGQGVIGVRSGGSQISLHKGALLALQNHADGMYGDMKVAFASSADTPFAEKVGRASLKMLEVVPGITVWDLVVGRDWQGKDVNQIGRQPPLSSNKAQTHFPFLKRETGIRYDRMLFFDDCNWGDHCGMVASQCKEPDSNQGPATVRTPNGLRVQDWEKGLEVYAKQAADLARKASS